MKKDGNVDIYLRLLEDLGLDKTILVHNDETDEPCHSARGKFQLEEQGASVPYCIGFAAARSGMDRKIMFCSCPAYPRRKHW